MILASDDPKLDLREKLSVEILEGDTYLIVVGMQSPDANEAASIVNAVVEAYITQHNRYHQTANRTLKKNLEEHRKKLDSQIAGVQKELTDLVAQGGVGLTEQVHVREDGKEDGVSSSFVTVAETQYGQATAKLFELDMELIEAKAALETARTQLAREEETAATGPQERTQQEMEQLEARIKEEFWSDPEVQPLVDTIHEARDAWERARTIARRNDDPAVVVAARQVKKLDQAWDELWQRKHGELRERLLAEAQGPDQTPVALAVRVRELEASIDQVRKKREEMQTMAKNLKVERTTQNSEQLQATLLKEDLTYLKRLNETVKSKLAQIDFEIGQEAYRVTVQDRAQPPAAPSNNKRLKYVAAALAAVLMLTLGAFLLLEIKADRVADPVALFDAGAVGGLRAAAAPDGTFAAEAGGAGADDQIEQFIQRLDHLRFGVCGNPAELEKGRCVLITSAIGGEGKTTLAAQLAARCGNAGMSTLLIDADLRRTGLCALLDIPEGPGLSDALVHDEPAATELVVPVQGGRSTCCRQERPCRTPVGCCRTGSSGC